MDELTTAEQAQAELAGRVLRWLAAIGLVVGVVNVLLVLAVQVLLHGWRFWTRVTNWSAADHMIMGLVYASLVLLVLGSAGLWRLTTWAKPVLFCYIAAHVIAETAGLVRISAWYWDMYQGGAMQASPQNIVGGVLQVVIRAWHSSLFALVLLVFLWRLKLPRRPGGGFEPIMRA
jgi:hypothetical protein